MYNEAQVVRLFFARIKPAYFDLTEPERNDFMARDRNNLDALGMQAISMIQCAGLDDEWDYIGVERWPSMEAIQQREAFEKDELQIARYVEYKTHLGLEDSFEGYGKQPGIED